MALEGVSNSCFGTLGHSACRDNFTCHSLPVCHFHDLLFRICAATDSRNWPDASSGASSHGNSVPEVADVLAGSGHVVVQVFCFQLAITRFGWPGSPTVLPVGLHFICVPGEVCVASNHTTQSNQRRLSSRALAVGGTFSEFNSRLPSQSRVRIQAGWVA